MIEPKIFEPNIRDNPKVYENFIKIFWQIKEFE